jgi:hypothetical protein
MASGFRKNSQRRANVQAWYESLPDDRRMELQTLQPFQNQMPDRESIFYNWLSDNFQKEIRKYTLINSPFKF